jgi:tRNA-specific 2-thiouridylase
MNKGRVIIGLSGGVDSSVAAALLKEQGYDVIGVYILGWTGTAEFPCNWQKEEADARSVAAKLEIPFYTLNLSKEYEKAVIDEFFSVYKAGGTPNPDILCNKEIKFKAMWQAVRQFEPDFIATGHYAIAKTNPETDEYSIYKGTDGNKDQSYFLWAIDQAIQAKIIFPLGEIEKPEVRKLAKKYDLPTKDKKDSQGICFIGPLKVRQFLASQISAKPGIVITTAGKKISEHEGLSFYTIGQRLGAGSVKWTGDVPPLFVVAKDLERNILIVGADKETYGTSLLAKGVNWLDKRGAEVVKTAKIRYRQEDVAVTVTQNGDELDVRFGQLVRAITAGQSIVFYGTDGELVGGAIISKAPEQIEIITKLNGREKIPV